MTELRRPVLSRLSTGVPGLDEVLGGGLPEYSFNLIAGEPGSGKTTLAHQITFANASAERKAIYFTVLGEPALKMLRYLQQMSFFAPEKLGDIVRFVDLSAEVLGHDLPQVLNRIVLEVNAVEPGIVVVDSFRTVMRLQVRPEAGELELQSFLQRLALYLTSWQATTFLVGEYLEAEIQDSPIFTVTDSILWLTQCKERSSVIRKLQVTKLRGQALMPGLHTFRITSDGLHIFPRILRRSPEAINVEPGSRVTTGVPGLDDLLHGGIPQGDRVLLSGPSGSGKTFLSFHFAAAPSSRPAVLVVFGEHPEDYVKRAVNMGFAFDSLIRLGMLKVIALRPLDLSVDEALLEIQTAVETLGANRLIIDSLTGFEVALAPAFRQDFQESLFRMLRALAWTGATILMTIEVTEAWSELTLSPYMTSFIAEDIFMMRYTEIGGALKKALAIVKMRNSGHSTLLHEFEITGRGIVIKEPLTRYQGILTGAARLQEAPVRPAHPGLLDEEAVVLQFLLTARDASAEAIAAATGLQGPTLMHALDRLVSIDYAIKVVEDGKTVYRPLSRALGN